MSDSAGMPGPGGPDGAAAVVVARQLRPALDAIAEALPAVVRTRADMFAYRAAGAARGTTAAAIAERFSLVTSERGIGGVPVTVFTPQVPLTSRVVFLHGGGLIAGNRFDGVDVVARHAVGLGLEVWSVEYPLAPEANFDAMVASVLAVLRWASTDGAHVMLAGQSAGGGLAAAVALAARDAGITLSGLMLVCPMLGRADDLTAQQFWADPSWSAQSNEAAWDAALAGADAVPPGERGDLAGLPATYLDTGSAELFRDGIVAFAGQLWRQGVSAELHVWSGGFHAFDCAAEDQAVSVESHRVRGDWLRRWMVGEL